VSPQHQRGRRGAVYGAFTHRVVPHKRKKEHLLMSRPIHVWGEKRSGKTYYYGRKGKKGGVAGSIRELHLCIRQIFPKGEKGRKTWRVQKNWIDCNQFNRKKAARPFRSENRIMIVGCASPRSQGKKAVICTKAGGRGKKGITAPPPRRSRRGGGRETTHSTRQRGERQLKHFPVPVKRKKGERITMVCPLRNLKGEPARVEQLIIFIRRRKERGGGGEEPPLQCYVQNTSKIGETGRYPKFLAKVGKKKGGGIHGLMLSLSIQKKGMAFPFYHGSKKKGRTWTIRKYKVHLERFSRGGKGKSPRGYEFSYSQAGVSGGKKAPQHLSFNDDEGKREERVDTRLTNEQGRGGDVFPIIRRKRGETKK